MNPQITDEKEILVNCEAAFLETFDYANATPDNTENIKESNTSASPNRAFQNGHSNDRPLDLTMPKKINSVNLTIKKRANHMLNDGHEKDFVTNPLEDIRKAPLMGLEKNAFDAFSLEKSNLQKVPLEEFNSTPMLTLETCNPISLVKSDDLQTKPLENTKRISKEKISINCDETRNQTEEEFRNQLTSQVTVSTDKESYLATTDKATTVTGIDNSSNLPNVGETPNLVNSPDDSDDDSIASVLSILAPSLS